MTVRIELPATKGLKAGAGTKVFDEATGAEITHVSRITLDIQRDCVVEATITVAVGELVNFNGLESKIVQHTPWPRWRRKLWKLGLLR